MSPNELISLLIVIGTQFCTFATGMADAGIDEFQFYFKNFSWTKQNPLKPTKAGTTLRDTHSQQNFALENTLKYCQLNQKRKICDPEHILTPADVAQLSRQLELIYHSTENSLEKHHCQRKGISTAIGLSRRSIFARENIDKNTVVEKLHQWGMTVDKECQKMLVLWLSTADDSLQIGIGYNSSSFQFPMLAIKRLIASKKHLKLFAQGKMIDVVLTLLNGLLQLNVQPLNGHSIAAKAEKTPTYPSIYEFRREPAITRFQFIAIAISAVMFSIFISFSAFSLFYYFAVVRQCFHFCNNNDEPRETVPVYFINGGMRTSLTLTELETVHSK